MIDSHAEQGGGLENRSLEEMYPDDAGFYREVIEACKTIDWPENGELLREKLLSNEPLSLEGMRRLKEFSKKENWVTKDIEKVKHGREVLRNTFSEPETKEVLGELRNPRILLYGSLQYGDPYNTDADVMGIVMGPVNERMNYLAGKMNDEILIPAWKDVGKEPHFGLLSSQELFNPVRIISKYLKEGSLHRIFQLMERIAIVLNSEALFDKDSQWLTGFQTKLRDRISDDPLVRSYVNMSTESAIEIRLERRGLEAGGEAKDHVDKDPSS